MVSVREWLVGKFADNEDNRTVVLGLQSLALGACLLLIFGSWHLMTPLVWVTNDLGEASLVFWGTVCSVIVTLGLAVRNLVQSSRPFILDGALLLLCVTLLLWLSSPTLALGGRQLSQSAIFVGTKTGVRVVALLVSLLKLQRLLEEDGLNQVGGLLWAMAKPLMVLAYSGSLLATPTTAAEVWDLWPKLTHAGAILWMWGFYVVDQRNPEETPFSLRN